MAYNKTILQGNLTRYSVSKEGVILNTETGKRLKPYLVRGYPTVDIGYRRGERITRRVHRLVAEAFISNPKRKRTVNHKDGDKENNKVDNLEWATHGENTLHAYKTGLNKGSKGTPKNFSREHLQFLRIKQIQKNITKRKFSIEEASEICEAYATGKFTQQEIADHSGVSRRTIGNLIKGESYA